MSKSKNVLKALAKSSKEDFQAHRPIMSFPEFLAMVGESPSRHSRSSVEYLRDAFLYYGKNTRESVAGDVERFTLFDAEFEEGRRSRVIGHERVQETIFGLLDNFARQGRVNKLIMLHGPNGSAKSTIVETMMRALEHYSTTEDGAIYRFNWVFPNAKLASGSSIGFGGTTSKGSDPEGLETYAYLEETQVDARIRSDLNDHPLLLLPEKQRVTFLNGMFDSDLSGLSDHIRRGSLSHTGRQIFDALMNAYGGDLERVMKHVQVERFYISRRYRVGAVTVEPQMRVDAGLRQLTADRSISALPTMLQNQTLFEPFGDLVDGNRGIVAYDDMFKRHPDLNKYLLTTSEKGTVSLEHRILHLDTVLIATANEDYLDAYKQTADYVSFKGRVELVRVPYLTDFQIEEEIYSDQLEGVPSIDHVAPHTTYVAALWAVLTRLTRPNPDKYPTSLRDVVTRISPLEKAELYATGLVPEWVPQDRARELLAAVPEMMDEGDGGSEFEGRYGASPREMKAVLLNSSSKRRHAGISPLAVFEELELLVSDPSVFPFLQMSPDGDYYRHENFIQTVREKYLDRIDSDILEAMGLVESTQYTDLFARYIDHVSQQMKGEKVFNRATSSQVEPDEKFMGETEELMGIDDVSPKDFRNNVISSIAAYSIDHPGVRVDYQRVFPNYFAAMKRGFFEEREKQTRRIMETLLEYFHGDKERIPSAERKQAESTLANLISRNGYREDSAAEAVAFLHASRYKD